MTIVNAVNNVPAEKIMNLIHVDQIHPIFSRFSGKYDANRSAHDEFTRSPVENEIAFQKSKGVHR